MNKKHILILFIFSLLNACTTIDYSRPGTAHKMPPVEQAEPTSSEPLIVNDDINQPRVITTASLDSSVRVKRKKSSPPASRQAVLDLLAQSKSAIDESNYKSAESLLKRALRIEPGNAWLWHNMAVLKFYQENYQQAIQQALKSNNLGKNIPQLRKNNSKVIRQSYIELGEPQKAQKY